MIFGLIPFSIYALIHVLLSVVGIIAGLVVVGGFMAGVRFGGWTATFLVTTGLTNLTSFGFPFRTLLPSHIVGGISLLILPVALTALYGKGLAGGWRRVFVLSSMTMLYFNVFVLIAQLFQKVPALIVLALTPQSPVLLVSELLLLALFVVLGRAATSGFRNERPVV